MAEISIALFDLFTLFQSNQNKSNAIDFNLRMEFAADISALYKRTLYKYNAYAR